MPFLLTYFLPEYHHDHIARFAFTGFADGDDAVFPFLAASLVVAVNLDSVGMLASLPPFPAVGFPVSYGCHTATASVFGA